MKDRLRLPFAFDPEHLRQDLSKCQPSDWVEHFVKENYEGRWHVLPLRAPAGAEHPVMMIYSDPTCETFVDTPLLDRCPYIRALLGQFDCRLEAVRLMRLGPDSVIREHRDLDLSLEELAVVLGPRCRQLGLRGLLCHLLTSWVIGCSQAFSQFQCAPEPRQRVGICLAAPCVPPPSAGNRAASPHEAASAPPW